MDRTGVMEDITGKRFGKGTVVKFKELGSYGRKWELECDCGNKYISNTAQLNFGHVKSCGCLKKVRKIESILKGVEKTSIGYGEASFRDLFRSYRQGALRRGLSFEITDEMFRMYTKKECVYCGTQPIKIHKIGKYSGEYIYNGIDRIDSSLGYIESNIVSCCEFCNRIKNDKTVSEFLSHVEKIYLHSCKNKCEVQ